jgi:tetratricopeptide (TPR) repeat protein
VFQIGPTTQRLAIRFGDWDYAAEHPIDFGIPDDKLSVWARGYRDGLLGYARGMKAAETGQIEEAERQSSTLDAQLWRLSKEKLEGDDESRRDRVLKILGTASLELRGDIDGHKGNLEQARKLLDRATEEDKALGYAEPPTYSRPPLEVLGEVLINAGKFSEAREAYSKDLEMRPKSGFALYGIALAWEKEGNHEQATKAYSEFLKSWAFADSNQPQIVAAKKYLSTQVAQK